MNSAGDVVGASMAGRPEEMNPRAFLWHKGTIYDLNDLVGPQSALYLAVPYSINDGGEIAGFGVTKNGEIHAYVASPTRGAAGSEDAAPAAEDVSRPLVLPENVRKLLRSRFRLGGR